MAIDEKKLIDVLNKKDEYILRKLKQDPENIIMRGFWHGIRLAMKYVNKQPKIDVPYNNVGKWIPCSERLPEDEGIYLVTCKGRDRFLEIVQFRYEQFMICLDLCEVIAWYDEPLPEPYKGEE